MRAPSPIEMSHVGPRAARLRRFAFGHGEERGQEQQHRSASRDAAARAHRAGQRHRLGFVRHQSVRVDRAGAPRRQQHPWSRELSSLSGGAQRGRPHAPSPAARFLHERKARGKRADRGAPAVSDRVHCLPVRRRSAVCARLLAGVSDGSTQAGRCSVQAGRCSTQASCCPTGAGCDEACCCSTGCEASGHLRSC